MQALCPPQLLSLRCPARGETLLGMLRATAAALRPMVSLSIRFHVGRYNEIITDAIRDGSIALPGVQVQPA